ncbi:MAG TPA: hypothetical protein VKT33_14655 [Candidatus Angelobacter sp.]|nr:hypothetical protein [Candidatus Angelobacter sp.]
MAKNLFFEFQALNPRQKRSCHIRLCELSLRKWHEYIKERGCIRYVESVAGTHQQVDVQLPEDAFNSAKAGHDLANVEIAI